MRYRGPTASRTAGVRSRQPTLCARSSADRTSGYEPESRLFKSGRACQATCARSSMDQNATLRRWMLQVRILPSVQIAGVAQRQSAALPTQRPWDRDPPPAPKILRTWPSGLGPCLPSRTREFDSRRALHLSEVDCCLSPAQTGGWRPRPPGPKAPAKKQGPSLLTLQRSGSGARVPLVMHVAHSTTELWPRGLRHLPAKQVMGKPMHSFESNQFRSWQSIVTMAATSTKQVTSSRS